MRFHFHKWTRWKLVINKVPYCFSLKTFSKNFFKISKNDFIVEEFQERNCIICGYDEPIEANKEIKELNKLLEY